MVAVRVRAYARARGLLPRMSRGGMRVTHIRAGFKRPNVFRELKLLTGVGVAPPRNCGTLAALIRAFPSLSRIIPAFAARERRSTTCGLPLSAYGKPRQRRVLIRFVTPTCAFFFLYSYSCFTNFPPYWSFYKDPNMGDVDEEYFPHIQIFFLIFP